jgi:hypothetical protein
MAQTFTVLNMATRTTGTRQISANVSVPLGVTEAVLTITPAGTQTDAGSLFRIGIDRSNDGGATWQEVIGGEWEAPFVTPIKNGVAKPISLSTTLNPGESFTARGNWQVTGRVRCSVSLTFLP